MTLMLTPEATETIRLLVDTPGAEGMRIFGTAESLDGSGPSLQIALVAEPEPEDAIVEAQGARLYLDPQAEHTMDDKILHADVDGSDVHFTLFEQVEQDPGA